MGSGPLIQLSKLLCHVNLNSYLTQYNNVHCGASSFAGILDKFKFYLQYLFVYLRRPSYTPIPDHTNKHLVSQMVVLWSIGNHVW